MSDSDLRWRYRDEAPRAPEGRFCLDELIGGQGPIELDIGFGRGLSLFERTTASPESRIIGIEVKTKLAYKAKERLQKQGLQNVKILCGDAREILKRAEPAGSLRRVSLHFPDPWWKKRHDKRRVIGGWTVVVGRVFDLHILDVSVESSIVTSDTCQDATTCDATSCNAVDGTARAQLTSPRHTGE